MVARYLLGNDKGLISRHMPDAEKRHSTRCIYTGLLKIRLPGVLGVLWLENVSAADEVAAAEVFDDFADL